MCKIRYSRDKIKSADAVFFALELTLMKETELWHSIKERYLRAFLLTCQNKKKSYDLDEYLYN
jgi:hypothetical protein